MPDLQALIEFPGVRQIESAAVVLDHGTTPSVSRLSIAPQQAVIQPEGDLTLRFGRTTIRLKNVHVDSSSYEFDSHGQVVSILLKDRRWKWRFGEISGSYNLRADDGTLRPETEQTPQQLARLCLAAMGEANVDVRDMPNDHRPTVQWEGENPAQALAELCDDLACRVVLKLDNSVKIARLGQGRNMPQGPLIDGRATLNPADRPDSILILCGRTRYQVDFSLEAVGLDADSKIKPIDELSYRPSAGWSVVAPPNFLSIANRTHLALARRSVFRWYRIAVSDRAPVELPGYGRVTSLADILPIEDTQVEMVTVLGTTTSKPAQVYGKWARPELGGANSVETVVPLGFGDGSQIVKHFALDTARGLVEFPNPVYLLSGSAGAYAVEPAELRIRTAVTVRDSATRAWDRHRRERPSRSPHWGTRPQVIRKDEIVLARYAEYLSGFGNFVVRDNRAEIDAECDHYLNAAEREYLTDDPATATFAGWHAFDLDGALQSIQWSLTPNGAVTEIARNQDFWTSMTEPFKIRRDRERLRQLLKAQRK